MKKMNLKVSLDASNVRQSRKYEFSYSFLINYNDLVIIISDLMVHKEYPIKCLLLLYLSRDNFQTNKRKTKQKNWLLKLPHIPLMVVDIRNIIFIVLLTIFISLKPAYLVLWFQIYSQPSVPYMLVCENIYLPMGRESKNLKICFLSHPRRLTYNSKL